MLPSNSSIKLAWVFAVLAVIGFLDATYLTTEHFLGTIPPCVVSDGCGAVLTSKWSTIAGTPIALMGALFYLFLLVLTLVYLRTGNKKLMLIATLGTIVNITVSAFLVSLQLFVIKQICFYCMVSAGVSTALFIVGIFIFFGLRAKSSDQGNLPL